MLGIAGNSPAWTAHPANLKRIGDEVQLKPRKVFLYVSPKLVYVQEFMLKVIPFKLATYRVSPMTKVRRKELFFYFIKKNQKHYLFPDKDDAQRFSC